MSQAVWLWRRTHINILLMLVARCWAKNSQSNIVSSFLGVWEAVFCVDIRFPASLCAPSPLLPSCFWHCSDPRPSAVCCGSHLHTCHEKTAVARHNIISAAEREGKACVAVPPSVYSPSEFNSGASVQWTNIFMIKTCKSWPPPAFTARTCNTITTKAMGEQGCWEKILYPKINMSSGVFTPHSCTVDGFKGNPCVFIPKIAP